MQPLVEIDLLRLEPELTGIDPRQIEQVGGQPRQAIDLSTRGLEEVPPRVLVEILVAQKLEKPPEGEQGRTELVRGVLDELAAGAVEIREPNAHPVERPRELASSSSL